MNFFDKLAPSALRFPTLLSRLLPSLGLALDKRFLSIQAKQKAQIMLSRALDEHTPTNSTSSSLHQFQYKNTTSALKPTHSSALNANLPSQTPAINPLKRTASQIDDLHGNVFFDENDFVEDNLIDLDEDEFLPAKPQTKTPSVLSSSRESYPIPPSSAALPWSPSPRTSNIPAPNVPSSPSLQISRFKAPPIEKFPIAQASAATKRRTLFWLEGDSTEVKNETLASKSADSSKSPYPWNKTASATKEAQKKLRKSHKLLTKSEKSHPENEKKDGKKRKKNVARVFLSNEQKAVLELVADKKKSVFFTGSAGTGKSVLLREIIKALRDTHKREPDRIAVTASTGLAACNIGGVTLHSFAGIGLGKDSAPELVKKIKKNSKARQRWQRVKVLVIDEISMVDGDLFDKLEEIARLIRNNGRPFGGIQLVITGDFFQLPPVPDYGKAAKFSFDASTWTTSIEHTIGLTQVFRQKDPGMLFTVLFILTITTHTDPGSFCKYA